MATTFSGTATTTAAELAVDGLANSLTFYNTGATNDLLVNIPRLHNTDFFTIPPGEKQTFSSFNSMGVVSVKSDESTTTYVGGVTEGTYTE